MKKTIYIILFIFVGTLTLSAQDSSYAFNSINFSNQTINGQFFLGKGKSVLTQNFGEPQSISKEYWETEHDTAVMYHYKGVVFYVVKNLVYSFTINSARYSFSHYNIKVGENIDKLKTLFPTSYKNRKGNSIILNIKGNDCYVQIDADSNNIITKIDMGDY